MAVSKGGGIFKGAKSLVTPYIQPVFLSFLYWALSSLGTIVSVWTSIDKYQDQKDFPNPLNPKGYDFIIVGAGSAGSLLAARLSQNFNVLLFEAGGEPNPLQFVPGLSFLFPNLPELDWQHRAVPQKLASLNSVNEQPSLSAGLGIGGSGTLDYMTYLRGHKRDFDNWGNLTDPSWSWEGVLPYFKSYENYEIPGDSVNHGYSGELNIETADFPKTAADFVRAGVELGYPNVDLNAPFTEGFDILRYPMKKGVRQAPYKAFLEPIRKRSTLTIMKFSQVNKVLFKNGNEAYGVEYDRHGQTYVAEAKKEVIICAGTVGTPKLLMLSGIGPQAHLDELNIPVISALPVGQNLQDHLSVYLGAFFIHPGRGFFLDRDLTVGQLVKWFALGRGILSSSSFEATGIFASSLAKERGEGDWPDIQLYQYGITNFQGGTAILARADNLKLDEVDRYHKDGIGRDSVFIGVTGARPLSRGYIQLGGTSPYDKPVIQPNYFGDPDNTDFKVMLEAVKKTMVLMENTTAGGVDMGATFTETRLPKCEHLEFRSDEYWECYIRRYTVSLQNPVGTAAMGSVVDTQLKVNGVKNLRVIDASVQPVIVTTSTQASTLMIAEKGAAMILNFWTGEGLWNKNNNSEEPIVNVFERRSGTLHIKDSKNSVPVNKTLSEHSKHYWSQPISPGRMDTTRKIIGQNNVTTDPEINQKLLKSLEDLKKMSKAVREQYDSKDVHFKEDDDKFVGTDAPQIPTSATALPYRPKNVKSSVKPPKVSLKAVERFNKFQKNYDYDDEHEKSTVATNPPPTPTRPPSSPKPPKKPKVSPQVVVLKVGKLSKLQSNYDHDDGNEHELKYEREKYIVTTSLPPTPTPSSPKPPKKPNVSPKVIVLKVGKLSKLQNNYEYDDEHGHEHRHEHEHKKGIVPTSLPLTPTPSTSSPKPPKKPKVSPNVIVLKVGKLSKLQSTYEYDDEHETSPPPPSSSSSSKSPKRINTIHDPTTNIDNDYNNDILKNYNFDIIKQFHSQMGDHGQFSLQDEGSKNFLNAEHSFSPDDTTPQQFYNHADFQTHNDNIFDNFEVLER